jgi:hypothetical protein
VPLEDPLAVPDDVPLLEAPPPSSPVTPELVPDDAPELVPPEDPFDPDPPEDPPPSPEAGGVELLLPPQPIPIAMAMQTPAQALEAYIRPPPMGALVRRAGAHPLPSMNRELVVDLYLQRHRGRHGRSLR